MFIIIPIRTETPVHRTPLANYGLIALNVLLFLLLDGSGNHRLHQFKEVYLTLNAGYPSLHEFLTYQFIHAGWAHLAGNMLFLWVFGNAVNARLGHLAYVLFYVAGGILAAWGYALSGVVPLLGASGSIAGITAAYLVLFPRSHVTVLYWFIYLVRTFEIPALFMIGFKIILWDNVIAPGIGAAGNVATEAHLAGYLFGFVATMGMLLIRVLPRSQFDMLALLKRWTQRRAYRATMADPQSRARAELGRVARPVTPSPQQPEAEGARMDRVSGLRLEITERLARGDSQAAAARYEELIAIDPAQCLSSSSQITVARQFYATGRTPQAVAAFERYLASYGSDSEACEIRLLAGIIYARDLHQYQAAERHLAAAYQKLTDAARREQCMQWLSEVRGVILKPPPPAGM